MSLWAFVCSVLLCYLWEKEHLRNSLGRFFSHRAHRVHWAFLRTVSSPQNASGIQRTQSVSAIVDTDKGQQAAYILFIGVSRWSLPFPSGEGSGEGPLSFWHLSSFVIMSFCLKKNTCLPPSLCYSVLKTTPSVTPVLLCYPVSHTLSPLMPCVLLSKDVYVCIFYKLSVISLHTQFFLLNLHN